MIFPVENAFLIRLLLGGFRLLDTDPGDERHQNFYCKILAFRHSSRYRYSGKRIWTLLQVLYGRTRFGAELVANKHTMTKAEKPGERLKGNAFFMPISGSGVEFLPRPMFCEPFAQVFPSLAACRYRLQSPVWWLGLHPGGCCNRCTK